MTTWQTMNWTGHAATTVVVDDETTLSGKHVIAECDTEEHAKQIAATPELYVVALELQRLMLVIESAVRYADRTNYAAVSALLKANNAAIAKAATTEQ